MALIARDKFTFCIFKHRVLERINFDTYFGRNLILPAERKVHRFRKMPSHQKVFIFPRLQNDHRSGVL